MFGSLDQLKSMLDAGWDANSATEKGTTALMMAAADVDKVRLLLAWGANVNARAKTRFTALMIAVSHRAVESVRLLLSHGADIASPQGQPALHGANPVFFAAWSGDVESAKALIQLGGSPHSRMILAGVAPRTALRIAIDQGDLQMASLLLRSGASVDKEDASGLTGLNDCVFKNDVRMAELLIANKADVNHLDKLGFTPLLWAANVDFGDSRMLRLLLKAGADPLRRTTEGLTPDRLAAKWGHTSHARLLTGAAGSRPVAHQRQRR
jgi:ankyrin repeat protein